VSVLSGEVHTGFSRVQRTHVRGICFVFSLAAFPSGLWLERFDLWRNPNYFHRNYFSSTPDAAAKAGIPNDFERS
jgi:hypothetical protein